LLALSTKLLIKHFAALLEAKPIERMVITSGQEEKADRKKS
jgi:hypothetical protein